MCEANVIPFQFRQLLENLFSNALKFSSSLKPVHIQVKSKIVAYHQLISDNAALFSLQAGLPTSGMLPDKQYCHISVCDMVVGSNHNKGSHIRYFSAAHNNNSYQGTGIGLAIVKK